MRNIFSQSYPAKPTFTEKSIPDLDEKVYIVTGSNTGVGKEVAHVLYSKHARVYVAARSEEKANDAIKSIKNSLPESRGSLTFLKLDLADLTTLKKSANEFLSRESKLHALVNNAGVMVPPSRSVTPQGYELQLGVNNIGTFLFTKLLTPILAQTAKTETPGTIRVVWVSSMAAEMMSHVPGGVPIDELDDYKHEKKAGLYKYGVSKAGNYLHATEYGRQHKDDGIVSIALNPGNLDSDLYRTFNPLIRTFLRKVVLYPSIYGAYTELFAALSPDVTLENSCGWVVPWGRFMDTRKDLVAASKTEEEGGTGVAKRFWEWTEEQIKPYL